MAENPANIAMETEDNAPRPNNPLERVPCARNPVKRVRASPDDIDEEVPDPKIANIALDAGTKSRVVLFIAIAHGRILQEFGESLVTTDLTLGARVASLLYTAHGILRQEANGNGSLKDHRTKEHILSCVEGGVKKTIAEICNVVAGAAALCGLAYTKPTAADRTHWFGTANPLISYTVAFKERLTEMRNGCLLMTARKSEGETWEFDVARCGVLPRHGPLCEGLNFNPSLKSSMAQSIGPMTQLIMFIRERQDDFAKKWYDALLRTYAHVTGIDVMLTSLRGKPFGAIAQVITLLGDIGLLAGTRYQHRACFPINLYPLVCGLTIEQWIAACTKTAQGPYPNVLPEVQPAFINYSGSGKGMWQAWSVFESRKWRLRGQFTPDQAKQVVYHAIFGTYNEDLSLLSQVTNVGKWFTRGELGACFQKMGTSTNIVEFEPPKQNYMCKLASAAQTTLLAGKTTQLHCVPVFSGHRKQAYLETFLQALGSNVVQTREIKAIEASLKAIRKRLIAEVQRQGHIVDMGTVPWFPSRQLELAYTQGAEFEHRTFTTTGKYFLVNE